MRFSKREITFTAQFLVAVILLLVSAAATTAARNRNPIIKPTVVSFSNLPGLTGPRTQQIREVPEGIPPYQTPGRIPDIRELKNVTFDAGKPKGPSTSTTSIGLNFEGITQNGYIPGEPSAAAGPLNIFSTGNVSVTVSDKDGNNRVETDGKTFFNVTSSEGAITDAVAMYDALHGHFVALCFTTDVSTYCSYYLAISQTTDARGNWYVYRFNWRYDNTTLTSNFGDFQEFGISDDKFVISSQQYTLGTTNTYKYQKLRLMNRDSLYHGQPVSYLDLVNFTGQQFVTKPGRNLSPDPTIYLLATQYAGGGSVYYGRITGPSTSPTLSFGSTITVQSYGQTSGSHNTSNMVPGGSTATRVNDGDCRTPNFVVRNGVLHIAWHFGVSISGTVVDALRYLKLNVGSWPPTLVTDETFSAAGTWMYYPHIMADSAGTIFMGFGRSSKTEYASSWVTGKRRTDVSIEPSTQAKAGTAVLSSSHTRWGDFTGGDMDETLSSDTGSVAWYAGQWAKATNTFGTWISQLNFPYCKINGQVVVDADGDTLTAGDRSPLSGKTVTMKLGSTTVAATTTDASGNFSFKYVDPRNYSLIVTVPDGYAALTAIPGSGGTVQSRVANSTLGDSVTGTQVSAGNVFVVTNTWRTVSSGNWGSNGTWQVGSTPSSSGSVVVNSGNTLTINGNDTCTNLTVGGTLQFDGVEGRALLVNGTLSLNTGSTCSIGNSTLVINGPPIAGTPTLLSTTSGSSLSFGGSSTGQTVPGSVSVLNNLTINNTAGVALAGNLVVNGTLTLANGALTTSSDTLTIGGSGTVARTSGQVIGTMARSYSSAGSKVFDIGTTNGYSPVTINATAGSFPTSTPFSVSATQGAGPGVPGTNVLQRYWTLTNGSLSTADLTFQYLASDVVGTESAYSVARKNPLTGAWEIQGGVVHPENHTATVPAVSSFSLWTLGESGALPIELASLTASALANNVNLEWTTISETNTLGFYVERTGEMTGSFSAVSSLIAGAGTSLEMHNYSYTDTTGSSGTYYYRLHEIDKNGKGTYSNILTVIVGTNVLAVRDGGGIPTEFKVQQNYPNPFNPATEIKFWIKDAAFTTLKVYNSIGQEVATLVSAMMQPGRYTATWNASSQPSGVYFYRLRSGSNVSVQRLMLVK